MTTIFDFVEYDQDLNNNISFLVKKDDLLYFSRKKIEILKNTLAFRPVSILDYGCATGRSLPFLKTTFPESDLYGCDISVKALDTAKKLHPYCNFFDLNEICFTPYQEKFDLVLISDVIHHIQPHERKKFLNHIVSMTTKNGAIFLFEHNPFNPITRFLVRTCHFDNEAQLISLSKLIKILENASLKIVNKGYCCFIPPVLGEYPRFETVMMPLPIGGKYFIYATK